MKKVWIIYLIIPMLALGSCHSKTGEESTVAGAESKELTSGELSLLKKQFKAAGMKVGDPSIVKFSNNVGASGLIEPALGGQAHITTIVPGRVSKIRHSIGDEVKKGEILFTLESREIIILQQEYAEAIHRVHLLQSEYDRQKALTEEKIMAKKEFLRTESEYNSALVQEASLKARLKLIHINPADVEEGKIVSELNVHAPISGKVSRQDLVLGQFVERSTTVMKIVDPGKLQLSLQVFERDLDGLVKGQSVLFNTPDREGQRYTARLTHIGSSVDPDSKTVHCIAAIDPPGEIRFVNNLYVVAKIVTCERETTVVPETALIRQSDHDFLWLLVKEEGEALIFRKIPVTTGITQDGQTEVLDKDLHKILLVGAYDLGGGE